MEQGREALQGGVSIPFFALHKLPLESGWETVPTPDTRRPLASQLLGLCFGPMVEKGEWPETQPTPCPIFFQEGLGTRYHSNCKQGLICFVDE